MLERLSAWMEGLRRRVLIQDDEDGEDQPTLWQKVTARMNPPVFFGAAALIIAFVIFGGVFTATASTTFNTIQSGISRYFGWYYLLIVSGFVVFCLWLTFGKVRRIRLGGPDAEPEFGVFGWFTMLFAAGMGIGLVFWSVAEPLMHYDEPLRAVAETEAARREAMRLSYFHWGLHAWAIYIVLALGVAYGHFNQGLPLAPRVILRPLIGDRIFGWPGHVVDILCTVGTLLGVATSLGLGAMQINAGLTQFLPVPKSTGVQITLILAITAVATTSVVLGVKKGIQQLSKLNLILAFALMVFVLFAGPTIYILETFVSTLGQYIQFLPRMSLYLDVLPESDWQADWTLFYWGWWISWSPFVAIFVARISRGRTIGEFVTGLLLAPTLGTFFWMAVFGGTALFQQIEQGVNLIPQVREDPAISLHALLQSMPLANLSMSLATLVIVIFFITSSDSGSLVDDMVTSGGDPNPPRSQRVFWAVSEGTVAAILLLVGGLQAIRNATISMGLFMSVLVILAAVALSISLPRDPALQERRRRWLF
jgi:choline/glycine/proline betaine transport protein